MMGISISFILALVALVIIGGGALLVRFVGRQAGGPRNPGAGWALVSVYLLAWLGVVVLFSYGDDFMEGFGVATLMFGMPWSMIVSTVLGEVLRLQNISFGLTWIVLITTTSLLAIALNAWLLFQFGQRVFAMLRVRRAAE